MIVKTTKLICGSWGRYPPGTVLDLPDAVAGPLIADKAAVECSAGQPAAAPFAHPEVERRPGAAHQAAVSPGPPQRRGKAHHPAGPSAND